ncbi:sugar ABC transporter substrate-binding protein [Celeribacter naphthalenivorans]|uniref:sugar ABC transporter substrate-binding protein n=1 Tax=Celeribacter naphthalenivorans TaxID=1614694 RepID=UPI001CFBFF75|nr:sugar ABC transporter substrate-binding protein [Celeribacter naphthalenivorans]
MTTFYTPSLGKLMIAATAALTVSAGCGFADDMGSDASAEGMRFGFIMASAQNRPDSAMAEGFRQAVEAAGGEAVLLSANGSIERMSNGIMDLVSQGVEGVATVTMDSVVALNWVERAKEAGIGYVSVTQQVGDPHTVAFEDVPTDVTAVVAENYLNTGHRIARAAIERGMLPSDGPAKIGIVEGQPGYAMVDQLTDGFRAELDAAGIAYDIVFAQPTDWTPASGQEVCANGLMAAPDADIIFSHAEDMAIGCAQAMEDVGATGKLITAAGGAQVASDLVRSRGIALSTCMAWGDMGAKAAAALIEQAKSGEESHGRLIETTSAFIDADTIDEVCPNLW